MEKEILQEQLNETKKIYEKISQDLQQDENEKKEIEIRIQEIIKSKSFIQEEVEILTHKKECLRILLDEIDIGYDKILASSQCLSVLASRKLRKLKRKYLKFLK